MSFIKILTISLIVSIIASIISIQAQAQATTGISESFALLMKPEYAKLWAISFASILIASILSAKTSGSSAGSNVEISRPGTRHRQMV